jgi:putative ABC transport system permease protein
MRQILSDRLIGPKYAAVVMALLGLLALVLAAVGIYGVVAYLVSRRTHEIGLRVALGAESADVLALVLGQAVGMTGVGVALGLLLALGAGKLMASHLLGTVSLDFETFAVFSTLLLLVSVVAAYVPARRALAVGSGAALRVK